MMCLGMARASCRERRAGIGRPVNHGNREASSPSKPHHTTLEVVEPFRVAFLDQDHDSRDNPDHSGHDADDEENESTRNAID